MNSHYYVYYRILPENAERARSAVLAMQSELATRLGLQGTLSRRRDDETTWMEVYEDVIDAPAFEQALAALADRHGLAALLAPGSKRKLEIFRSF
jgi:hypothetical protein